MLETRNARARTDARSIPSSQPADRRHAFRPCPLTCPRPRASTHRVAHYLLAFSSTLTSVLLGEPRGSTCRGGRAQQEGGGGAHSKGGQQGGGRTPVPGPAQAGEEDSGEDVVGRQWHHPPSSHSGRSRTCGSHPRRRQSGQQQLHPLLRHPSSAKAWEPPAWPNCTSRIKATWLGAAATAPSTASSAPRVSTPAARNRRRGCPSLLGRRQRRGRDCPTGGGSGTTAQAAGPPQPRHMGEAGGPLQHEGERGEGGGKTGSPAAQQASRVPPRGPPAALGRAPPRGAGQEWAAGQRRHGQRRRGWGR